MYFKIRRAAWSGGKTLRGQCGLVVKCLPGNQ